MYACVQLGSSLSFKHVGINNNDPFCLYNVIKILSDFLISVLVSGWNSRMNLPNCSRALESVLFLNSLHIISISVLFNFAFTEFCNVIKKTNKLFKKKLFKTLFAHASKS